jgi:hypothetical protein
MLQRSSLFAKLANREAPTCNYKVINEILPSRWHLSRLGNFCEVYKGSQDKVEVEFAKTQEEARKDIDKAFDVLQTRFAIVRGPTRFWDKKTL